MTLGWTKRPGSIAMMSFTLSPPFGWSLSLFWLSSSLLPSLSSRSIAASPAVQSEALLPPLSPLTDSVLPPPAESMSVDEALILVEQMLLPKRLNDLQQLVFCHAWQGQSYEEMAEQLGYDFGYIKDVGAQLWLLLSQALGEKVTKKSVQAAVRRYQQIQVAGVGVKGGEVGRWGAGGELREETRMGEGRRNETGDGAIDRVTLQPDLLEFPSGAVPLSSVFYVARSTLEAQAYREIQKPGGLIRIRAPKQMGKSSLMHRIVAHAKQQQLQTVSLNLQRADRSVFKSLDEFLRWLCANVSQQLGQPLHLEQYWSSALGSKMSCTMYFQQHVLKSIDTALVLALDEVNCVFEYPELAGDFLPLLRSWYEDASEFEVWQKLRLIVVHATEAYIPLNLHQSPFNVGLPIKLLEFTVSEVQALALRHGLSWAAGEAGRVQLQPLVALVGGHPHLIRLALYHLAKQDMTLAQVLATAATTAGIYSEHLRHLFAHLVDQPTLAIALQQVLSTETAHLEAITAYKLESLGLIKFQGDRVYLSCELYRAYFRDQF